MLELDEIVELKVYNSLGIYNDLNKLVAPNGLIKHSDKDSTFHSTDNIFWGMFLLSLGKEDEAKNLVNRMYDCDLVRSDDLVDNIRYNSNGIRAYNNCLWGLFLKDLGEDDKANNVLKSMDNLNLIREDGLIYSHVDEKGNLKNKWIYSSVNSFWGMFLNSLGKRKEAVNVLDTMCDTRNLMKYNIDGLPSVVRFSNYYERIPDSEYNEADDVRVEDNINFGLFLSSINDVDYAEDLLDSIKRCHLSSENLIGNNLEQTFIDGFYRFRYSLFSKNNASYGLFLQSLGKVKESRDLIDSLNDCEKVVSGNLLKDYVWINSDYRGNDVIDSKSNSLWGLLHSRDGYKLLTGQHVKEEGMIIKFGDYCG